MVPIFIIRIILKNVFDIDSSYPLGVLQNNLNFIFSYNPSKIKSTQQNQKSIPD